jgi:hypothetical protein
MRETLIKNAAAKDLAEESLETLLGNKKPPTSEEVLNIALKEFRKQLEPFGGRITKLPKYGNVPVHLYGKTMWGNGY